MGKSRNSYRVPIFFFFWDHLDLLCVNLETKVSSQLSSKCNIWWHGEAEGRCGVGFEL